MDDRNNSDWKDLFGKPAKPDGSIVFRLIKKSGREFLMLPESPASAAAALELYPAQTAFAKAARAGLLAALWARLPLPLGKATIPLDLQAPFSRFLAGLGGGKTRFPCVAILVGNPRAPGRRFILLLFDEHQRPMTVVKAGTCGAARELIRAERSFLQGISPEVAGLPKVRDSFTSETVEAFAQDYIAGGSPVAEDWQAVPILMTDWLLRERQIRLEETPAWQALKKQCSADPLFLRLENKLGGVVFNPVIYHGDFTPWNIKVSRATGDWTAIDWERGNTKGIPGWDWFHFLVQTAILVQKQRPETVFERLDSLLHDSEFQTYAKSAGISGVERVLAAAYLFYCIHILQQSEGIETVDTLMTMLVERWL